MTVASKPGGSRLDPEPVPRRDVLGLAALGSMAAALGFALLGMLRLPKAAVLASPSRKFAVTVPEHLPLGEAWVPPGRNVALVRDAEGVFAISLVCTHLGCIVRSTAQGFECPCHGSLFTRDGEVLKGPAPKALPWYQVTGSDGTYTVDEGVEVAAGTRVSG
jgi:cytochrome b6-f complex iron-sulfur subunit